MIALHLALCGNCACSSKISPHSAKAKEKEGHLNGRSTGDLAPAIVRIRVL